MTSQLKTKKNPAESMVGAYRTESTDLYTAGSGITAKIPPLFDGSTSCFKDEELIDDWLDLTVREAEERRPSTEEQTCRRCRTVQKDCSTVNLGEPPMESSISEIR